MHPEDGEKMRRQLRVIIDQAMKRMEDGAKTNPQWGRICRHNKVLKVRDLEFSLG